MNDAPDNAAIALLVADRLVQRVQTNPLATLAGVAGVGYVLARGIPNSVLRLGTTMALRAVSMQVLAGLTDGAANDRAADRPAYPGSPPDSDRDGEEAVVVGSAL